MKNENQTATLIRWTARITSTLSLAFIFFFLYAQFFGEGQSGEGFSTTKEILSFICFPLSTIIGFLLAWKWEGIGGMITMGGAIGFFLLNADSPPNLYLMGLTAPGLLFLIYWFLTNEKKSQKS